jgi:hypothetical protein
VSRKTETTDSPRSNSMKLVLLIVMGALAACVTVGSEVVPVGKDTYQMSMTGVGFATQANTNIKALKAANDYCAKLGKHMVPKTSAESGVYGWSPRQNNLVFMCLDANDPRYLHPEAAQTTPSE